MTERAELAADLVRVTADRDRLTQKERREFAWAEEYMAKSRSLELQLEALTADRDRLRAALEQIEPIAQRMSLGWLKSEICRLVRAALSDTGRP